MPYENEHSCRLKQPVKGAETKRVNGEREHNGKKYDVIFQKQKEGSWPEQAYRYPVTNGWSESEAREHCKEHKGILFEPAKKSKKSMAPNNNLFYANIITAVTDCVLAITEEKLHQIKEFIELKSEGVIFSPEQIAQATENAKKGRDYDIIDGTAVLGLYGILSQKVNLITEFSGGTSTEEFTDRLQAAIDDPNVENILIDIDSPGGSVFGIAELSDIIYSARAANGGEKYIIAIANSMAASGAYWIASAADHIVVTDAGLVGSVGVVSLHRDISRSAEMQGIKFTVIRAGKYKYEGNVYEPLTDETRSGIQQRVDDYYNMFVEHLARNRVTTVEDIQEKYGQGRVLTAKRAINAGMADEISTFPNVLKRIKEGSIFEDNFNIRSIDMSKTKDETEEKKEKESVDEALAKDRQRTEDIQTTLSDDIFNDVREKAIKDGLTVEQAKAEAFDILKEKVNRDKESHEGKIAEMQKKLDAIKAGGGDLKAQEEVTNEKDVEKGKSGDAATFEKIVDEQMKAGKSRARAIIAAAKMNPEAHNAWLESQQPKNK